MKRFVSCLTSLALAIGLMPLPAYAKTPDATALSAQAPATSLFTQAQDTHTVKLADELLFGAVKDQLDSRSIPYTVESADNTLSLDVSQVTELDLSNRYLSKLGGLGAFTHLTSLNISNNDITDYAPLSALGELVTLKARDNRVKNIDALCGLTKLEHLDLAINDLVDDKTTSENSFTSKLSTLVNLKHLDLSHDFIRYTNGLEKLAKLEYLDLYDNGVHDLSGLVDPEGLEEGAPRLTTSLKHLDLGQNNEQTATQFDGLENLADFKNLTYLDFSQNQTPSIVDHIGDLKNLEFLQLQDNKLESAEKLVRLTKLKTLILAQNNITSIEPLLGMEALVELNLKGSRFGGDWAATQHSLDGIFDDTTITGLVWPNLKKLDLSRSWRSWGASLTKLADLDWRDKKLQVNFEWRQVSDKQTRYANLPHYDEKAKLHYVTYEDFGARANGTYDDYIAMVNAHDFANEWQEENPEETIEVRGTEGKTYHVFAFYETDWNQIMTNVDWNGATIVIHDEDIENKSGRSNHLFVVRTLDGGVAFNKRLGTPNMPEVDISGFTVDTTYKAYGEKKLPEKLVRQFPAGYDRYVVTFYNEDKMQHIRSGEVNMNNGEAQCDIVVAQADGTLENDVQWDFDHLTRVSVLPMPSKTGYIRNANIVSTGVRTKSQAPYYRGNGKYAYYNRNFYAQYAANIDISGITHRLGNPDNWKESWDEQSGSYFATIDLNQASNITLRDSSFYGRKYSNTGRSTYDVCYGNGANIKFVNIKDSTGVDREHRWSVIGGHGGKDILFQDCVTSSAGTHQTVYNMTIRNCDVGSIILCGQGLFLAENTTCHEQYFASLRNDYGTTWNGEVRILNCTHAYNAKNRPKLIDISFNKGSDGKLPEYGYPMKFPEVFVDNLTVDYKLNNRDRAYCRLNGPYYAIYNSDSFDPISEKEGMPYVPADYWPSNLTLNSVKFVNGEAQVARKSNPEPRFTASKKGTITDKERNFLASDVRVKADGEDVTAKLFLGEPLTTGKLVEISVNGAAGVADSFELAKSDGAGGFTTVKKIEAGSGAWEGIVSEPGDYEARLSSESNTHGWKGSRTLRFTVTDAPTTVTLPDANLHAAVKRQLEKQGVHILEDDEAKTITLVRSDLAGVTELDLSTAKISSLSGLSEFTALERLDLSHNSVSDITELAGLTALEHLDLYDNYVHDFGALGNLKALTHLNLGENNEISKGATTPVNLDALAGLVNLTYLDFSENYTPSIPGQLTNLKSLAFLNLQYNNLTDISALASLVNLEHLILSHNSLTGVSAVCSMTKLQELNLNSNNLYNNSSAADNSGINALTTDKGELALPSLKKLDICGNYSWNAFMGKDSRANVDKLFALAQAGALELEYAYDFVKDYDANATRNTKIADLPHPADESGAAYVTYDDFGAYRDGVHDDFNAIRNAHRFANAKGCEVRATPGAPYHIFRPYDLNYYFVYTNVDWQGAEFVIHDEDIDGLGARYVPLLCLRPAADASGSSSPYQDITTIPNPPKADPSNKEKAAYEASPFKYAEKLTVTGTLNRQTTTLAGLSPELDAAFAALNAKRYSRYYVQLRDENTKHYKRYGANANGGSDEWDGVIVDGTGKLEEGQAVQWDFATVTQAVVTPIPAKRAFVRNAAFTSTKLDSKREAAYSRSNKPIYYLRNLQVRDCANVEVSNVKQSVGTYSAQNGITIGDDNDLAGSYSGFFALQDCADVQLDDCEAWARRYDEGGRSTYGLVVWRAVNLGFSNFNCSNPWEQLLDEGGTRWGIMGTNHSKHVVFSDCTVNRIDAHEGFYDMTARRCKLGSWGFRLIGQGPLLIEDCDVYANSFIMLRGDYGSTWDGDARIVNCTHHCIGQWMTSLFSITPGYEADGKTIHNFGYPLRFPNLTVENLTVDDSMLVSGRDEYCIVPNHEYDKRNELLPEEYWPDKVEIKGLRFVNYEKTIGHEPKLLLVASEKGTIESKLSGYSVECEFISKDDNPGNDEPKNGADRDDKPSEGEPEGDGPEGGKPESGDSKDEGNSKEDQAPQAASGQGGQNPRTPDAPAQPSQPSSSNEDKKSDDASDAAEASAIPIYHVAHADGKRHAYSVAKKAFALARKAKWGSAKIAFYAPRTGKKVYEIVNKKTGARYYTADIKKTKSLKKAGWKKNGVAFHSLKRGGIAVYCMRDGSGAYKLAKGKAAMKAAKKRGFKNLGVALRASR